MVLASEGCCFTTVGGKTLYRVTHPENSPFSKPHNMTVFVYVYVCMCISSAYVCVCVYECISMCGICVPSCVSVSLSAHRVDSLH